jgi:alpha-beta hydrolase superfamily lysophospholipase
MNDNPVVRRRHPQADRQAGNLADHRPRTAADSFTLRAPDGASLFVYRWLPDAPPRAAVQIAHGVAEHAGRYARLAAALTAAGYAVFANDHRGHGRTARTPEDLGFFAARGGWWKCQDDLWQLNRRIAAEYPGVPIVLLGQSMGSFLAQHFISAHGDALAGVVLAGSNGRPARVAETVRRAALEERERLGPRGRSALLQSLTFGAFNKPFEPARTPYDWLSRDPAEVDRYVADPLCGFQPTVQLWIDLLDALYDVSGPVRQALIPRRLPVHVIAGTRDPVGGNSVGLRQLLAAYRSAGLERVTHRFYPKARHELFNEVNHDEVTRDLIAWLDGLTGRRGQPGG